MTVSCSGRPARRVVSAFLAAAAMLVAGGAPAAEVPPGLAGSGVALVPADAAFFSATLRAREQYDRFVNSNAYAALRALPAVKRALDSLEEQRSMPGNPFSMVDSFLQLPENAQAAELLADMAATDTFVYGEPSCAAFAKLVRKLVAVAQAIGALDAQDRAPIEKDLEIMDDEDEEEASRLRAIRLLVGQLEVEELPTATRQKRLIVQALIDNIDLIVVPDVVWGFRTTKVDVAKAQLARLEALAKSTLEAARDANVTVARKQVAGGDLLVFTDTTCFEILASLFEQEFAEDTGDIDGFEQLVAALKKLDLCVALGVIGDRVILSVGDSTDHLAKLAAGPAKGLLTLPALAPLLAHADKPLTGISYWSGDMAKALAQTADDVRQQFETLDATIRDTLDQEGVPLPDEALAEVRAVAEKFAVSFAKRMPEPGPATGFSYLTDAGYEGYAWDWSRNQPLDGSRRLDLLEHAGGAPLAVVASRLKNDPQFVDDMATFVRGLWSVFEKHGMPALDDDRREEVEEFTEHVLPLAGRLTDVVRGKLLSALADGQIGFVIDGKSRSKKPQRDLPSSAEALPLPEPAIVLSVKDAKLFREGLSDLFALGDDTVAAMRDLDPAAVPPGYRVPDPEKSKVEAGTIWTFPLSGAGLDEQVRPAIGVGDDVAVFSLAPKQATRLLGAAKLETGAQLAAFEEPLAGAAAVDVAGLVDAVKPWVVYLTRYGCVREREGVVEADVELQAADETEQARDALQSVDVVLEVAKCLRAAVAEIAFREGALVTHWRNVIRDLPAK